MGLFSFNQERERTAQREAALKNTPVVEMEVEEVKPVETEPIAEEVIEEPVEEVKPKKTDAEKLKKKTKQQ